MVLKNTELWKLKTFYDKKYGIRFDIVILFLIITFQRIHWLLLHQFPTILSLDCLWLCLSVDDFTSLSFIVMFVEYLHIQGLKYPTVLNYVSVLRYYFAYKFHICFSI